jgi:biopolymer transport protein ExbD
MAGVSVGEGDDNPVAINVTPLVDIIFCLCVFFMISFKFKQIEGKFDTWLAKNKGAQGMPLNAVIQEIRVALLWDDVNENVVRKFGTRQVPEDDQLQELIRASFEDYKKIGKADVPLTIDADSRVPWREVMTVINLAKRVDVEKIEFAYGAPPPKR